MPLPSELVLLDHELAQLISLVCIGSSVVQLLPTIRRVLRRGSTAALPFWPHVIEALWRWWFCAYLFIVVRGRRPLGVAPAEGWLAGRDRTDLFLYGDTLLLAAKLWAMLGLFVTLDRRPSRRLFAAVVGVGLPLVFYSLALWDSLPSAVLETGMALKDVIILGSKVPELLVRVRSRDSGQLYRLDRWRYGLGATCAALRALTTVFSGSDFVGRRTLIRGWAVITLTEGGLCLVTWKFPGKEHAKTDDGGGGGAGDVVSAATGSPVNPHRHPNTVLGRTSSYSGRAITRSVSIGKLAKAI